MSSIVVPSQGFVVKGKSTDGKKVFVNVCYSNLVRNAHEDSSGEIRIPVSIGPIQADVDKKGNECTVVDIIVSEETAKRGSAESEFRKCLIDLLVSAIKLKYDIELEQIRKLKIGYKGVEVQPQRIRLEKQDIVREITPVVPAILDIHFDFVLKDLTNQMVLDVLKFPEYRSTEQIIRENLAHEFYTSHNEVVSRVDLSSYSAAEIHIHNILNPYNISLEVSRERLVFRRSGLKGSCELSVCVSQSFRVSDPPLDLVPCSAKA